MPLSKGPWFGRHRTGFGWGPRTWQGWVVVLAVLAVVIIAAKLLIRAQ